MRYKVCIIGGGMIAVNAHIPAYISLSNDFEIVAVADFNIKVAKSVSKKFGITKFYDDIDTMLKECKPDIVSVCTPNLTHKEYTIKALRYGANVLCEKPLAIKLFDAEEMFCEAERQGKVLMACQSLRFLPERQAAKKMVDDGSIGDVYYAEFSRIRRRGIPTWGKFHIKEFSGGGAFLDIGVHAVDSALWLMGNPVVKSVNASMQTVHTNEMGIQKESGALKGGVSSIGFNPNEMNVESFSSGSINLEDGRMVTFKVAWSANLPEENNILLSGTKSGINLEKRKIFSGKNQECELKTVSNGFAEEPFFGHFCLVENMLKVLKGESDPIVTKEEILNVTAIIEAAYISAEKKREVLIKEL